MLEQLANEEDDDADYYVSDGGNYNYLYSSPYDSGKDSVYMVSKLVHIDVNIERVARKGVE
jgi:hypothetical protein